MPCERAGVAGRERVTYEPDRQIGYLEAHIEQGPHLEAAGLKVGVVSSIVGIRSMTVSFRGEQNHAGTTPMTARKDAAGRRCSSSDFVSVKQWRRLLDPPACGRSGWRTWNRAPRASFPVWPNSTVQFRDPDESTLERMEQAVHLLAEALHDAGPVEVTVQKGERITPTVMNVGLQEYIAAAAEEIVPGGWTRMPSAAGHDPMVLSHHMPCAMLFIPSIGGISHDFAEDSLEADIVTGCRVLASATQSILVART